MANNYVIYHTNGSIIATVAPGTINDTSADITLVGMGYPLWGQQLNNNLIRLVESFACEEKSPNIPKDASDFGGDPTKGINHPLPGQLWYNSTQQKLMFYKNATEKWVDVDPPFPDLSVYVKHDGSVPMSGNLNLSNNRIINVSAPVNNSDAATKQYVDAADLQFVKHDGSVSMTGNLDLGNNKINNLANPSNNLDAVNKQYVDNTFFPYTGGTITGVTTFQDDVVFDQSGNKLNFVFDSSDPTHFTMNYDCEYFDILPSDWVSGNRNLRIYSTSNINLRTHRPLNSNHIHYIDIGENDKITARTDRQIDLYASVNINNINSYILPYTYSGYEYTDSLSDGFRFVTSITSNNRYKSGGLQVEVRTNSSLPADQNTPPQFALMCKRTETSGGYPYHRKRLFGIKETGDGYLYGNLYIGNKQTSSSPGASSALHLSDTGTIYSDHFLNTPQTNPSNHEFVTRYFLSTAAIMQIYVNPAYIAPANVPSIIPNYSIGFHRDPENKISIAGNTIRIRSDLMRYVRIHLPLEFFRNIDDLTPYNRPKVIFGQNTSVSFNTNSTSFIVDLENRYNSNSLTLATYGGHTYYELQIQVFYETAKTYDIDCDVIIEEVLL